MLVFVFEPYLIYAINREDVISGNMGEVWKVKITFGIVSKQYDFSYY